MRLLITGASGLLGLNLALDAGHSHEIVGVDRNTLTSVPFKTIHADLLAPSAVKRVLSESDPELVIHCAAMADVDECEAKPDLARQMNTELPAQLADACARRKVRLVHISTDAVFDGQKEGSYSEEDAATPSSVYSKTKYEGEQAVLAINPLAIVARVNFYGWSLSGRPSLAGVFFNNLSTGKHLTGFTGVTFSPMLVHHLCEILLSLLAHHLRHPYPVPPPPAATQ